MLANAWYMRYVSYIPGFQSLRIMSTLSVEKFFSWNFSQILDIPTGSFLLARGWIWFLVRFISISFLGLRDTGTSINSFNSKLYHGWVVWANLELSQFLCFYHILFFATPFLGLQMQKKYRHFSNGECIYM